MRPLAGAAAILVPMLAMSACAVIGPTVPVTPGAGKSEAAFESDRRDCMVKTDLALQPVANQLNGQAATVAQVGANNEAIQAQYDRSYDACMASHGNLVAAQATPPVLVGPIRSPSAGLPGTPPRDSPSNGPSLSDAVSASAISYLEPTIRGFREDCPGEAIAVDAYDAPITPFRSSRIVALTEPHGGFCLGQPGENDYLLMQRGPSWMKLLAAEPGSIDVLRTRHEDHRDVELHSLGPCVFSYHWTGDGYSQAGSRDCPFKGPPDVRDVAGRIRRR